MYVVGASQQLCRVQCLLNSLPVINICTHTICYACMNRQGQENCLKCSRGCTRGFGYGVGSPVSVSQTAAGCVVLWVHRSARSTAEDSILTASVTSNDVWLCWGVVRFLKGRFQPLFVLSLFLGPTWQPRVELKTENGIELWSAPNLFHSSWLSFLDILLKQLPGAQWLRSDKLQKLFTWIFNDNN